MGVGDGFEGFTPDTLAFFAELRQNNDKLWFEEQRARYERSVLGPSRDFVVAMGAALRELAPDVNADPRVNRSLFRIFRDTRFSADKSPYKTHLGLLFWEGEGKRMERPGFYFHLEPDLLMLGTGIYLFPKPMLEKYREAVADEKLGPALVSAAADVGDAGTVGEARYKRVPRGYPKDHPRAEWLKFGGLWAAHREPPGDILFGPGLVEHCLEHYRRLDSVNGWLRSFLG